MRVLRALAVFAGVLLVLPEAQAQCPEAPRLQNYSGSGEVTCPCFVTGEEAGATFAVPAEDLPIEILRVGIGWGSQFGGNPQQIEEAIRIYPGGLPAPGAPVFELDGPQLADGVINEFDLEPLDGSIIVSSSPFSVTLRFLNSNAGDPFAPSVVHDGNGCQPGKNLVRTDTGQWLDACALGVSGDWVFYVIYRPLRCPTGGTGSVPDGAGVPGSPLLLEPADSGAITLTWAGSCSTDDDDYAVYEGVLGFLYSHIAKVCSTGGATTATIQPAPLDTYYLVVPHDGEREGSYGRDGAGSERPQGGSACHPREVPACP